MLRRLIGLLAVAVLFLGVSACSSDGGSDDATTTTTPPPVTIDALNGKAFVGDDVTGHDLVKDTSIRLSFEDGTMAVNGGCNTMTAVAEVDGELLQWIDVAAATMMACKSEAYTQQDTWLREVFTTGVTAELADGTLTLNSDDATIVLTEEDPADAEDASLEGPTWTLEATIDGKTDVPVPDGVEPPTLAIAGGGTATVFGGCNNGSSQVTVATDGKTATFGPLAMTQKECPDGGSEAEASVLAVLDGEVEVHIQGNQLTLTKGDQALRYHTI